MRSTGGLRYTTAGLHNLGDLFVGLVCVRVVVLSQFSAYSLTVCLWFDGLSRLPLSQKKHTYIYIHKYDEWLNTHNKSYMYLYILRACRYKRNDHVPQTKTERLSARGSPCVTLASQRGREGAAVGRCRFVYYYHYYYCCCRLAARYINQVFWVEPDSGKKADFCVLLWYVGVQRGHEEGRLATSNLRVCWCSIYCIH